MWQSFIVNMSDKELIDGILGSKEDHDKALSWLFRDSSYRRSLLSFLKRKGLNSDGVLTVWTDTVIQFGWLVRNGKYNHEGKLIGYLKNLANYIALNFFRKNKRIPPPNMDQEPKYQLPEDPFSTKELGRLMDKALTTIGEPCKNILNKWALGYSMKTIKEEMNIISEEATRKRKHDCLKKLYELVDSHEAFRNLLKDYMLKAL